MHQRVCQETVEIVRGLGSARITKAIAVLGHQVLACENPHAKDDDGGFAGVRQERISATTATSGDTNGEPRR